MSQMLSQFSLVGTRSSSGVAQVTPMCKTGLIKIATPQQILRVCFKAKPPQTIEDSW